MLTPRTSNPIIWTFLTLVNSTLQQKVNVLFLIGIQFLVQFLVVSDSVFTTLFNWAHDFFTICRSFNYNFLNCSILTMFRHSKACSVDGLTTVFVSTLEIKGIGLLICRYSYRGCRLSLQFSPVYSQSFVDGQGYPFSNIAKYTKIW